MRTSVKNKVLEKSRENMNFFEFPLTLLFEFQKKKQKILQMSDQIAREDEINFFDIDKYEDDPLFITEYSKEIYENLKKIEVRDKIENIL